MEKQGWKTLAIISTILLILAVIGLGLIFFAGEQYLYHQSVCAYDICGLDKGEHDSYFYADLDDYCYCFSKGELEIVENVHEFLES